MKANKPKHRLRWLPALILLAAAAYLFMYAQAKIVHIEYADVYLNDLPDEFDGVTLLYVSDVHIASVADARHMQALMDQLETFNADILLLGGDYSDVRLWDQLRCFGNTDKKSALKRTAYAQSHLWMASLADFDAPLGKFAVQGNHDCTDASLMESLAQGGVQLLMNEAAIIEKNGAQLAVAGVGDYEKGAYEPYVTANQVQSDACCILLSHNPDALPQLFTTDANGGGNWIDLALSGHTHGGQVRIGNFVPINNSSYGLTYLTGWCEQPSGYSLTSNGVGTTALPIRLGAPAQVHLITLRAVPAPH